MRVKFVCSSHCWSLAVSVGFSAESWISKDREMRDQLSLHPGSQSSHVSLSPHRAPAVHSSPLPHSQNIWSPRERFSVTTSGGIHFIISTILENECTLVPANTGTGTGPSGVQLMLTQSRHTSFLQWMFTQAWKRCRDNSLPVKSVKKSDDSFKSSIQKDSFERILIYSIMTQFPLNNCVCRWW